MFYVVVRRNRTILQPEGCLHFLPKIPIVRWRFFNFTISRFDICKFTRCQMKMDKSWKFYFIWSLWNNLSQSTQKKLLYCWFFTDCKICASNFIKKIILCRNLFSDALFSFLNFPTLKAHLYGTILIWASSSIQNTQFWVKNIIFSCLLIPNLHSS